MRMLLRSSMRRGLQLFATSHRRVHTTLLSIVEKELAGIKRGGTWKYETVITGPQGPRVSVADQNGETLNFCANNYLGLANNTDVIVAGIKALKSHGAGMSSVRFICGTQNAHKRLEAQIAEFHSREDAILYPSCYDANAGMFEVLLSDEDAIISDELNHASIIDGIRLCKAKRFRYKHCDMADLEKQLRDSKDYRLRMIATDGVFSMDGTVAKLAEICDLAERYDSMVFIDECHATGLFGKTGRGTEEFWNLKPGRVDIINSTLGKALGGASGGYTVGPKPLIDLLRQRSRPYLYSNSIPPSVTAQASKVFEMITASSALIEKLAENTRHFRKSMTEAGFTLIGDAAHPVAPVMLYDEKLAYQFAHKMLKKRIFVVGLNFPAVSRGKARIRVQLSAAHSEADIDRAVSSFIEVGKELNVI